MYNGENENFRVLLSETYVCISTFRVRDFTMIGIKEGLEHRKKGVILFSISINALNSIVSDPLYIIHLYTTYISIYLYTQYSR